MLTKIEVTWVDIADGETESPGSCPIAIAAKRATKEGCNPMVGSFEIYLGVASLLLPPEARAFVRSFDRGDDVKPIAFELDIPSELLPDG